MNPENSGAFTQARKLVPYLSSNSSLDDEKGSPDSSDSESDSSSSDYGKDERVSDLSDNDVALEKLNSKIEELDIHVPPEKCEEFGKVKSLVENQVIVEPRPGLAALDLGTILFLNKGEKALGRIEETFGPILEPLYIVLFSSAQKITEAGIISGTVVYYAPSLEHTSYVFLPDLLKMQGSDASWEDNKELPPELQEPSDTEDCSVTNDAPNPRIRAKRKAHAGNSRWTPNRPPQFPTERKVFNHNSPQMPIFNRNVPPPNYLQNAPPFFSTPPHFPPPPPVMPGAFLSQRWPMFNSSEYDVGYIPPPGLPPPILPPPQLLQDNRLWQNHLPFNK